ncbi:MAG: hypothetical protein WC456_03790 [Patescibacteria group bacterium]
MKRKAFLLIAIFCLAFLGLNKAQETASDTSWILNERSGLLEKIITTVTKTEQAADQIGFKGVDPDYFSREKLDSLIKNGRVNGYPKFTSGFYPTSLCPILKREVNRNKVYEIKDGFIQEVKRPLLISEPKMNILDSIAFLAGPVICLVWLAIALSKRKHGCRKMMIFLGETTLALLLVALISYLTCSILGLIVGTIGVGFLGTFFGPPPESKNDAYPILGGIIGALTALFVSQAAGTFGETGQTLDDPAFTIVWEYIFYYGLAGLLAFMLEELLRKINKKNVLKISEVAE